MTITREGVNRTSPYAGAARPFPVVQAIGATLRVRALRRFKHEIGDHASQPVRNPWLVRKGKDLLLVLGILGGMLSFSIFNIKGAFAVNLSMFAFQCAAGFIDIFILVLLLSRADCMMVAGPVFGTVCLGIAGGYVISGVTGGAASTVVGAANLVLTIAVFIFIFLAKKLQMGREVKAIPAEVPLTQATSIIRLPPLLQKRLSDREMAVLDCVLHRKTFRETAKVLSLSESSVKTYMKRIYEKTGVTGKNELFSMLANSEGDGAGGKES